MLYCVALCWLHCLCDLWVAQSCSQSAGRSSRQHSAHVFSARLCFVEKRFAEQDLAHLFWIKGQLCCSQLAVKAALCFKACE
jgi:hypothetical protein